MHFFLFLSLTFFLCFILVSNNSGIITPGIVGAKALRIIPSSQIPLFKIRFSTVNKSCPRSAMRVPVHSLARATVPERGRLTIPQIFNELFFTMWHDLFCKITKWGFIFFSPEG